MKAETFEKAVKKRAHERVQERITIFRKTVSGALCALGGDLLGSAYMTTVQLDGAKALQVLISGNNKGWPLSLWTNEEIAVRAEILTTLDEVQRALLAASQPEDPDREMPEEANDADSDK